MSGNTHGATHIEARSLRCKERQRLQSIIPLSTPFAIYIDPANACNFHCTFCPTAYPDLLKKVGRPKGLMKMELFRKIVEDLKEFDKRLKIANLYKDGEPLLNRDFPEMVRYLKDADVVDRIWTKTNGALLKPELNEKLANCGLDMICISVEAVSSEGYKQVAGANIDYVTFKQNVRDLYERTKTTKLYVKIADTGLSELEARQFFDDFQSTCSYISIEKLMGWSNSSVKDFRLGTRSDTYDGLPLTPKLVCPYPFYTLAVNFDGSVSLCCADWAHDTVVGNAATESLRQIWEGERLYEFRKMMLEGRRNSNRACGDCHYIQVAPDNIDAHRGELLERIRRQHQASSEITLPDEGSGSKE